jgi:hypothetical protein
MPQANDSIIRSLLVKVEIVAITAITEILSWRATNPHKSEH